MYLYRVYVVFTHTYASIGRRGWSEKGVNVEINHV